MWEAWTTGTLGVWLVIEAFLRFSPRGNLWNDLLVGLIIAVVGMLMTDRKPWQGWSFMDFPGSFKTVARLDKQHHWFLADSCGLYSINAGAAWKHVECAP